MTLLIKLTMVAAILLGVVIPFAYFLRGDQTKTRYRRMLASNVVFFFGLIIIAGIMIFVSSPVMAANGSNADFATGLGYLAAAISTGASCIGGGIAVASAASAALGAISEDPSALGKSLIFVGLAEGVCLYGLIISFMIIGKL